MVVENNMQYSSSVNPKKFVRNGYIDFLKGLTMLLVILGHALQYGNGMSFLTEEIYWDNLMMKVIYSFHMPLFISVSGYLFYFSVKRNGLHKSIWKRFKVLIPVCSGWAVILMMKAFISGASPSGLTAVCKSFFIYFITDFWFFWSILAAVCCMGLVEPIVKRFKKLGGGMYLVIFIAFFFTPDSFWLGAHKFMIPFFIGSFYVAKYHKNIQCHPILLLILTLSWLILLSFYSKDTYIYTTGITLLSKNYPLEQIAIDFYRWGIGAVGVISFVYFTKWIYHLDKEINICSVPSFLIR